MIHDLFHASALAHALKSAVIGHSGRVTYAQLERESGRLAESLTGLGAKAGDRVAVLMTNSAEAAVSIWAALEAGCILVPLHPATRKDSLEAQLRDSRPKVAIIGADQFKSVPMLRESLPADAKILAWRTTQTPAPSEDIVPWELADVGPSPSFAGPRLESSAPACLIYTSGTTGEPKGALLSHANMRAAIRAVNAYLQIESSDVLYSALPLASSYGLYQLVMALSVGATVLLDRTFAFPARSLALAAAEKATIFAGVPTMYAWIATSSALEQIDLSRLRIMTSAAAALPIEHARRVRDRLPNARLFVMYGQTECKRISFLHPDDIEARPGSVGRGMPFQEHRLIDETGREVAPGEIGELVVRGPHVMQCYWENDAATQLKLRSLADGGERWLHTGDVFRTDDDGFLYFLGRRDDILKIGGNKVSPREIEDVLCQMPAILEVAIVGMPDDLWGQAAKAHIVLREGATCDADEVLRFCRARLRGFMVPKAVVFEQTLPKTESGKIKKRELS